ncbi:uncharacterized protein LOC104446102 [Eucalyptus grandis]|uniref:uncharacterized protein LOC104446102 n=1 Tax=Eucalyptus grandis TaxID=71139 RepID=UPI00192E77A9|nr:uncharacterized protein LOC104446102 [Eucalyptus grandis]
MADPVAISGIGLISCSQGKLFAHAIEVDGALQAFWVSFLLLHLGGPNNITAFSLEDNSLWQRHLLSPIFQVSITIYVFVQVFPSDKSLMIPTMLVFLSGIIKNLERILALNLSSLPRLKESMLTTKELTLGAYLKPDEELKNLGYVYSNEEEKKIAESIVVKHAYYFFQIFKFFIIDSFYTSEERLISCKYFSEVSAVDALRVISVELNFIYEILHTKALTVRSKWSYIFRFIAFIDVAMAFVLFNGFKKHQLPKLDVEITYILLFGGIALDVINLFILIFSDWTIARIMHYKRGPSKLDSFLHGLISTTDNMRKPQFATCKAKPNTNATYTVLHTPFIFRRWSESICTCNVFFAFLKENQTKMPHCDQHWGIMAVRNIYSFPFSTAEKIISCFHQITGKVIDTNLSIYSAFPRYVFKNPLIKKLWIFIFEEMRHKSENADNPKGARKIFEARGDLYLQVNQPNVVSVVASFAKKTLLKSIGDLLEFGGDAKGVEQLCEKLYNDPIEALKLESPLRQGIVLARKMERLRDMKWEVMSGVWVEILSYAAGHIKGEAHVLVLSKGGELLAFVWLLMAHFGCLYKPEWDSYGKSMFGIDDYDNGDVSTVEGELV